MGKDIEIDLGPEHGWGDFTLHRFSGGDTFVTGDPEGNGLRVKYFVRESDGAVVAKVWFGPGTQGPPAHAHGGSVAAVLDEAMGAAVWMSGHAVLAGSLTCHFRNMIPLGTVATLAAWKDGEDGRKICARSTLEDENGKLLSEGEGIYIEVPLEKFRAILAKMKKGET